MNNLAYDHQRVCKFCEKDHKREGLKTFHGAYGTYCVPIKRYNAVVSKIKWSPSFRVYLNISEVFEKKILDPGAWKANHQRLDTDAGNTTCIHAISGGCMKCFPDSYCGSEGADEWEK